MKEQKSAKVSGGGLGFCSALALLFIALKLCGVISWSWIWVLAPLWIGVALALLIAIIAIIVTFIIARY